MKEFRGHYHSVRDKIGVLLQDRALEDKEAFQKTNFVDSYRYSTATNHDTLESLKSLAPFWRKPEAVDGFSSNCMMNDVGIRVHIERKGYHNYAIPAAWDVRFGYVTRAEALAELESEPDLAKTKSSLKTIKYLWFEGVQHALRECT